MPNSAVFVRRKGFGLKTTKSIIEKSNHVQGAWLASTVFPKEYYDTDVLIRWGCTSNIPNGKKVLNKAKAIHATYNKALFRESLFLNNLTMFTKVFYSKDSLLRIVDKYAFGCFPVVIRPLHHFKSKNFFFIKNAYELIKTIDSLPNEGYISDYIKKDREFRVHVVGNRIVQIVEKFPENKEYVAWNYNVEDSSHFKNVKWSDWPQQVAEKAIKAHMLSGLDFSAIDIIVKGEDKVYVLECNTSPGITSNYTLTCYSKAFDYELENLKSKSKSNLPDFNSKFSWKNYIHPSLY